MPQKSKRVRAKTKKVQFTYLKKLQIVSAVFMFIAFGVIGVRLTNGSHAASNCTVSSTLVNSCRPWLGAAVEGYPQVAATKTAQFQYAEQRIGHQMDIFHDYHQPGSLPLNSDEIYFAKRSNTYIYVNWKPASNWADADGGNASVNASIDQAAANIKSIAPHKIFLTIWHEPENDVSGGTSCAVKPGSAGTPAQYRAMWQNVENRFKADGVTNVVYVMNYMGYYKWDCLIPEMWPGNDLVDWVTYDVYSSGDSSTVSNTIGRLYNLLETDNSSTTNFESKPWGAAEWGDCNTADQAHVYSYYQQMKTALDDNTYPRLKMYMVYDDNGNNAGMGCLTEYSKAGTYDPTEQTDYNNFADDPIFTSSYTQPSDTTPPSMPGNFHVTATTADSVSVAWNASSDNVGVAGYRLYRSGALISTQPDTALVDGSLQSSTTYSYTVQAFDSAGNVSGSASLSAKTQPLPNSGGGSNGGFGGGANSGSGGTNTNPNQVLPTNASVTGAVDVGNGHAIVYVDGQKVSSDGNLNTTYLTNGQHTVTVVSQSPNGTTTKTTKTITVQNQLPLWKNVRDVLFSPLKAHPLLMNVSFFMSLLLLVGMIVYGCYLVLPDGILLSIMSHTPGI